MRVVLQRILEGSVTVEGNIVGAIGPGLLLLVGISSDDTDTDLEWMARKVLNIRLWPGAKPWSLNVMQKEFGLLVVSQFTLHAILKGNRPDFHSAMEPARAREVFGNFVELLRRAYVPDRIATGEFGSYMEVAMKGDGPVTITLDTKK
mmetsp:Transcript_32618/g.56647  ORF Transcript_32618/g.56647 Transcript_32618/m.56647 type:complete len:148 (-) Transcript_32618:518-961(-)